MLKFRVLAVMLVLLAGCATPDGAPGTPASSSTSAAQPPACDSTAVRERDDRSALRCVLRDSRFPRLEFDVTAPGAQGYTAREQTVVVREGTRVVQTIVERTVSSAVDLPFVPRLANDGDGQLVVVTSSGGSGGIGMAFWRARSPEGPFVRGGELFGFPHRMDTTDEGFSTVYAHASAVSGVQHVFRFDGDRVVPLLDIPVAAARIEHTTLDDDAPTVVNRATRCEIVVPKPEQATALRAAGVDPDGAGERFCAQAWVGRTYAA
ncbi:hypothetical protein [Tsukamurella pulmonis]|uniref:hypothetical protein n=1 Tax=Tsukamurella pulmonis TaxID=47312 RepID=UPI001058473F|nr:hypothetical protein [Tsukamurella pulmonis]